MLGTEISEAVRAASDVCYNVIGSHLNTTSINARPAGESFRARRRGWGVFFVVWTILAGLAAWWLMTHAPSSGPVVVTPQVDQARPWVDRVGEWLTLAHLNFHPIYPWILLAPYVIWLGVRFHVERRGWFWRAAVLLAAGAGFVLLAREFTQQVRNKLPRLMVVATSGTLGSVRMSGPTSVVFSNLGETNRTALTNPPAEMTLGKATITIKAGTVESGSLPLPEPGEAGFFEMPPASVPSEIVTLIGSNVMSAVRSQLDAMVAREPSAMGVNWTTVLNVLSYLALLGLAHTGVFYRRYREREDQALALEGRLNRARLSALQAQLQPHFLFNALNGIAALVRRDPAAAEEMITSLSELLRLALSQSDRQEITLREELAFLTRYLEIQQMRFRDRLRVEQSIDPAALDGAVPALLLQPLAENAIRHGIEPSDQFGILRVSARLDGARLVLQVEDNGVGLNGSIGAPSTGVGLANVRERLAALYPGRHEFELGPGPGGGAVARISIPWRTLNQPEAAA